jgi:hypothetical protein
MAWTERYVRADADGSGNGTTDANSGANGSWTIAQAISGYAAGHRVNIKAGSYSVTGGLSFGTAGTITAPVLFRGYKTTIGDMDDADHGTFMSGTETPAFDLGSNRLVSTFAYLTWQNIDMQSSQTTNATARSNATGNNLIRCRVECTATNINGRAVLFDGSENNIINCWCKATTTATACIGLSTRGPVLSSTVIGGVSCLASTTSGALIVGNCILSSPGSDCINIAAAVSANIFNNVFYNSGRDGIRTLSAINHIVQGNIFSVIGGVGINNASGTNTALVFRNNNAFHSITTSQEAGFGDTEAISPISLSGSPFVDAAGGDFNINNTAGGGADLRAATVVLP